MDQLIAAASRGHAFVPIDVLAGLTLLSVLPFALVMCTSFVRIVVVLSLVRSAIGASALPPNAVLTGLALVLTLVVMAPTLQRIDRDALGPYSRGSSRSRRRSTRAIAPLTRVHAAADAGSADVRLFERVARRAPSPPNVRRMHRARSGLRRGRTAQRLRDRLRALSAVRRDRLGGGGDVDGLGMMMLSPPVVSLPVKLLLFVMVDGWALRLRRRRGELSLMSEPRMRISDALATQRPFFSFEFFPPKDDAGRASSSKRSRRCAPLRPAFVSITYGAGGSTRARTVALAKQIQQEIGLRSWRT